MGNLKLLFVATSHGLLAGSNNSTGIWLEELASPYYLFKDAGIDLRIASPDGGAVPVDPKSQSIIVATRITKRFLNDEEAMNFLSHALVLSEIQADDYDAVFLPGGHGPMWDLADNKTLKLLLEAFNQENKPIGAVCQGVVGLLTVLNSNGAMLVKGKRLTSFSNSEEERTGLARVVPFLMEDRLGSLGAIYSKGPDYLSYVVADGNIITGQNPASSGEVAKKVLALLPHHKNSPVSFAETITKKRI